MPDRIDTPALFANLSATIGILPAQSDQSLFTAAMVLSIPPQVRQSLRDAVATTIGIPIDAYRPDVEPVDLAKQAAYDSDVDDLFECWLRKHVFDCADDRLFREALRLAPVPA
ncbi:MAG: hypothetical protein ACJ780_05535 [Solirubrobacteraceae bacterium]|jgi:hypothetical protein